MSSGRSSRPRVVAFGSLLYLLLLVRPSVGWHDEKMPTRDPSHAPTHLPTPTPPPSASYDPTPVPTYAPTVEDPGRIPSVWFTFVDTSSLTASWGIPIGNDDLGARVVKYQVVSLLFVPGR